LQHAVRCCNPARGCCSQAVCHAADCIAIDVLSVRRLAGRVLRPAMNVQMKAHTLKQQLKRVRS
jgi:hypothetical protein